MAVLFRQPDNGPIRPTATLRRYIRGNSLAYSPSGFCAAEITRPTLPFFPSSGAEGKGLSAHAAAAASAAMIGWPRGDLWVDNAMVDIRASGGYPEWQPHGQFRRELSSNGREGGCLSSRRRARVGHLGSVGEQSPDHGAESLGAIGIFSYYTLPYNEALFPIRISNCCPIDGGRRRGIAQLFEIRARNGRFEEAGLQIVGRFLAAYNMSTPAGKQLLESLFKELNLSLQ